MTAMLKRFAWTSQNILRAVSLAAALAATPAIAWQHAWRNLTGTVTDGHHEPLRGAVIQVHNEADNSVMSYITGRSGNYFIKRLDPNTDYTISATYHGAKSKRKELSHFDSKANRVIDLIVKTE